jgi:transglutaminase-like putative cysteine protease
MDLFEIRYLSRFLYPQPVWDSHNVLRACPCSDERQILLSYKLAVSPAARVQSYVDYFGTRVDLFGVARPHRELEVVAEIRVAMQPAPQATPPSARGAFTDEAFALDHHEYLAASNHCRWAESVRREAREVTACAGHDAAELASALCAHVGKTLHYAPGSTHIGIDVNEIQRSRRGVCQDFAHYLIALCRSIGLPARYVSGYLFALRDGTNGQYQSRTNGAQTQAQPHEVNEVVVQTHSWVEVAVPGVGWWALDPTNRLEVGARHVKIGHGRDYDDVLPLRGLYHGPFQHELEAEVRMKRLVDGAAWSAAAS